jgi:hypothetical protein
MDMHVEKLRETAAELERQLSSSANLDADSRAALELALFDIRAALEKEGQTSDGHQSLIDRLRVAVEKFEGSHPTLTGTLMRLIDGLGEMGI